MTRLEWNQLAGVTLHDSTVHDDSRGNFAKLWDAGGVEIDQVCTSYNSRKGTLRGLHVQVSPSLERKLLWCTAGALWDVLVDTRRDEPTFGSWSAIRLTATEPALLEVPPGIAHGYQTLVDGTSVGYLISGAYDTTCARTLAFNDPTIAIPWPLEVSEISVADRDGQPWPLS